MSQSSSNTNDKVVAQDSDTTSDKSTSQDTSPPITDRLVGQRVGNYRLLERVGEGATAMVYRAEHVQLGRIYAVKILHPMIATRPGMRDRFLREAQMAAQLEHDNIIFINDFAVDPQFGPYMVMEYLSGHTLKEVLTQEGPLPLPRVLSISLQLCQALALAHSQGIIHRDLKPENIFLEHRPHQPERVKILDFGIARLTQSTSSITGDGKLIGTPLYMSPEQCRGQKELTPASDIYSYGITLYEMLTGTTPFQSDSPHKLIIDHFLAVPPELSYAFPEDLRILQRELLAKEPEERPQNFVLLARRLREAMEQTQAHESVSLFATLEDAEIPPIILQQIKDTQDPHHLQLAPHVMAGSRSPVQRTMLYHPAVPDSRPGLPAADNAEASPGSTGTGHSRLPPELYTQEQLPVAQQQEAATFPPLRDKTSVHVPKPSERKPVVVRRRTPVPPQKQDTQDPLLSDLEQLFSHPPSGHQSDAASLAATAWDVPIPHTPSQDNQDSPSSTHPEVQRVTFQGNTSPSESPKPYPGFDTEGPSNSRNTPESRAFHPSFTQDWSVAEPVIELSQPKSPPTHPQFASQSHSSPPQATSSYLSASEGNIAQSFSTQQSPFLDGQEQSEQSSSPGAAYRDSLIPEAYRDSLTPESMEEALFGLDSATEIDLSYPTPQHRKQLSQRWWFWLLLFCAFGATMYLLYGVIMGPTLPPLTIM